MITVVILNKGFSLKCDRWLFTNLYTTNATRALFPCWDDPSFKSTYNISIKYPTDYTVFFSQPAQKTSFDEFGTQWTHYEDFSSVESYSLAFALIDGITRKYEQHGIHFMWNRAKAKGTLSYAHQMADKSLSYFIQKLQLHITSDFPKIDHIVLPNSPMKSMGGYGVAIYRYEQYIVKLFLLKSLIYDTLIPSRSISAYVR